MDVDFSLEKLHNIDLEETMKRSFIEYSMAVITSRALPDVRDGFKPVHRRIIYTMNDAGNTADKPFRKCAYTVGRKLRFNRRRRCRCLPLYRGAFVKNRERDGVRYQQKGC